MTLPLAQVRVHCLDNSKHTIIFLLSSTADYTPLVSSELTFGPTASTGSTQCTSVSLVDDDIVEDTEQFSVEVSSTSDIVLIASPSFAVYSIADDLDSKLPSLITVKIVIPLVSLSLSTLQLLWCPWKTQPTQLMRTLVWWKCVQTY